MRDRVRSEVEIAKSSSKLSNVHSAVVMSPTALVFCPVKPQLAVIFGQLARAAPFCPRKDKILPERATRPVFEIRTFGDALFVFFF